MGKNQNQTVTVSENIFALRNRINSAQRQISVSVDMLAEYLAEECENEGVDGVYSRFCNLCPSADAKDKAQLCYAICSNPRLEDSVLAKNLYSCGDMASDGTQGKIAYVKNRRSDDAFLSFAARRKGAKAMYVGSFSEACEAVFDNACEFCILPVENSREGKLYSFYSMMDRYELKICGVTVCETDDGSDGITFALVGRRVEKLEGLQRTLRFEFSLIDDQPELLTNILLATGVLGGKVVSVGTQPVAYDELKSLYYFSIDFVGAGADALALYIAEEYSRYTPLGLYVIK